MIDRYSNFMELVKEINETPLFEDRINLIDDIIQEVPEFKVILDMIFLEFKPYTFNDICEDKNFRRMPRRFDKSSQINYVELVQSFPEYCDESNMIHRVKISRITEDADWMDETEFNIIKSIMNHETIDFGLLNHALYEALFSMGK